MGNSIPKSDNKKMEYERKSLVNELKKNNIDFVDTYEYLHGKKNEYGEIL